MTPLRSGSGADDTLEEAWQYDVRGNVRANRRLRASAEGGSAVTTWRYDAFDRLTSTTEPPSCQGSGCLAPVTDQVWDRNDNVTETTLPSKDNDPDEDVGTTTGTKSITPDAADRPKVTVDESGARTEERYDRDDLVVKRYAPRAFTTDGGTPSVPNERFATEERYDGGGRQVWTRGKVSDGGSSPTELITETIYDRDGNPTELKTPGARARGDRCAGAARDQAPLRRTRAAVEGDRRYGFGAGHDDHGVRRAGQPAPHRQSQGRRRERHRRRACA